MTAIAISGIAATDGIYIDDAGSARRMSFQDMGIRVVANDANQTFALGDANSMQTIGATNRTWTIPAASSVSFNIGAAIYCASNGAGTITLDPAVGVTLTSVIAQASTANRSVLPGGLAVLIYQGGDDWKLAGDIS